MRIIGIDYGRIKIGLAVADGPFAEPLKVIRFNSQKVAIKKIEQVVAEVKPENVVVGISEGKMANETEVFVRKLRKKLNIPIYFQDETLTTKEAAELALKAGIKRKKRKHLEDAYSATIILQNYLDFQ